MNQRLSRTLSLAAGALGLALFASCHTSDPRYNHWRIEGLVPRASYHLLRHDTNSGKPYYETVNEQRQDITKTIQRHLIGHNPDNPFQNQLAYIPPQKRFSPLPDPLHFFHLSSLAVAGATLGAGGAFFVFPPEAVLVAFEDGGAAHMWDGVERFFTGRLDERVMPPDPSEFEVRNR